MPRATIITVNTTACLWDFPQWSLRNWQFLVVIDSPQKHHYGGLVAAPVFKEIVQETFNYLNVPPVIPEEPAPLQEQLNVSIGNGKIGA